MLKSRKHVFWEALIITIVIFLGGIFLGMTIEESNSNKINQFYLESEISLADATATSSLTGDENFDCEQIKNSNVDFANRVYEEAVLLEEYEKSGMLTENMKILHKKYDLLRTMIWTSNKKAMERCDNYDIIVYLYEGENEDTVVQAKQNVWSKILYELKLDRKDDILLLPISIDKNLTSLELVISEYEIENFPVVIINNEIILYEMDSVEGLQDVLNNM